MSSIETGLTASEAQKRLSTYGPNAVAFEKKTPPIVVFLLTLKSPLIILLVASSILSAYFGDIRSCITIISMVFLSSILDFVNTYKSDQAAQKLKDTIKITSCVVRDGKDIEIHIEELVPGDVVKLRVGDIVPADGTISSVEHLHINESALTGESFPAPKEEGGEVWMGSSVTTGKATLLVTATGSKTRFSHIVANLSKSEAPTEFDREVKDFSALIIKATAVLVVFVFLVNIFMKGNYLEALMFAVALAVGMTPEMMPMIIAINLSKGSLAMAKRGVIVKRLSSIQNFGSLDLLCTDKTGTLTEDSIALVKYVDAFGKESEDVLLHAYLNSQFTDGFKNPLDEAIQDFKHLSTTNYEKLDEIPFDFIRRRETVIVDHQGHPLLITKGAPEEIFAICKHAHKKGVSFSHDVICSAKATYEKLSTSGFRVLALATRDIDPKKKYSSDDERDLTFLGLLAFLDPPKTSVSATLKKMQSYGIGIKIITGDNDLVSKRIAQEINLKITGVLLGTEMDELSDDELNQKAHGVNLFAKVNPDQKLRIIKTLQAHGHVVGYIGDGINDAPSLKAADVGISVNNATDIAKESADIIMMRKDLDDLVQAVIEGRKTFVNTMKYLMMSLSSNFGNMFSMAGASVFLPFLPMLPAQVLFNNLLYDSSQFTLPADNVDEADLMHPKKLRINLVRRFMVIMGPISSIFDFLTFGLLYGILHLSAGSFQTGWFIESLATQIFVVYIIRTKLLPFIQSRPSKYLVSGTLLMVLIGWVTALTHFGHYFAFSSVPTSAIIAIVLMVLVYLIIVQFVKQWFYSHLVSKAEILAM